MLGVRGFQRKGKIANKQAEIAITTMPPPRLLGIDFPVLPTTAMGHVLHAIELLRAANLIARLRVGRTAPRLGWRLCDAQGQPMPVTQGPCQPMLSEGVFEGPPQAQWVLSQHTAEVPTLRQTVARHGSLRRHLAVAIDQGQRVLTLGNGAWWAAGSGRLSGHRVALPWYWAAAFHRDHPDVVIVAGTEVCVDGPWFSAALPQDTGELVLALVAQCWDHDLHAALASVLPGRAHAALVPTLAPRLLVQADPARLFLPLEQPLASSMSAIAVRKGDPDFLRFLDTWLAIQREEGWLEDRAIHWSTSTEWLK